MEPTKVDKISREAIIELNTFLQRLFASDPVKRMLIGKICNLALTQLSTEEEKTNND